MTVGTEVCCESESIQ